MPFWLMLNPCAIMAEFSSYKCQNVCILSKNSLWYIV